MILSTLFIFTWIVFYATHLGRISSQELTTRNSNIGYTDKLGCFPGFTLAKDGYCYKINPPENFKVRSSKLFFPKFVSGVRDHANESNSIPGSVSGNNNIEARCYKGERNSMVWAPITFNAFNIQ